MRDMTYQQADALLTGRCKKSRRIFRNGVYIYRDGKDKINLRYWYYRRIMTWYKNGRKTIYKKGIRQWRDGSTEEGRVKHDGYGWIYAVNWFIGPWHIKQYRGHVFIGNHNGEWSIPKDRITIYPNGTIHKGQPIEEIKAKMKRADYLRDKPRRRGRYWRRRARNLYVDRSKCVSKVSRHRRWECKERYQAWPRITTPHEFECGCRTYRKNIKFDRTVAQILDESNATIRTAMIKIYGIQKFFIDAKAKIIDKQAGYQLMELDRGEPDPNLPSWQQTRSATVIRAVQMECPSTGQIYVQAVPAELGTVPAALDWIYQTPSFLDRVGVQT